MANAKVTLSGCSCYTMTMSNLQLCALQLQYMSTQNAPFPSMLNTEMEKGTNCTYSNVVF